MTRVPLALAAVLLAAGCATPVQEPIPVYVPYAVPCDVAEPARPRMDTEHLSPTAKVDVQARAMRAEIDRREAYETQLRVALRACTAPSSVPKESFHD